MTPELNKTEGLPDGAEPAATQRIGTGAAEQASCVCRGLVGECAVRGGRYLPALADGQRWAYLECDREFLIAVTSPEAGQRDGTKPRAPWQVA